MTDIVQNIKQFLSRPFLMWEYTATRKLIVIFSIVCFSAVFISIYNPFNLNDLPGLHIYILRIVHALVNLVMLFLFYFIIPLGFKGYFNEDNRTIGREILWVITLITCIAIAHKLANVILGVYSDYSTIKVFLLTLSISVFPFVLLLVLAIHRMRIEAPHNQLIELHSNSGNDKIKIQLKNLLYIKALDNYSEIYFYTNNEIKKKVLRVSLSTLLHSQLKSEYFFRSHRSYIVNLFNLEKIELISKASKIYLKNTRLSLPLSINRKEEFLNLLSGLPISYYS